MSLRSSGLLALALLLAGCGGNERKAASGAPGTTATGPITMIDPATAGNVTGTVWLEGTPPADVEISMVSDPACGARHGGPARTERAVVRDGRVEWAFIYVREGLEGTNFPAPSAPAEIDQAGCRYTPHVTGVTVNQPVEFVNSDETLHNVHSISRGNKAFNFGLPKKNMTRQQVFTAPEIMVHLKCDVHSWMSAWIGVVPHPFFAVSDAEGNYTIRGLPPGTYTLEAWHETFGTKTVQVTLGPAESKTADVTFQVAG